MTIKTNILLRYGSFGWKIFRSKQLAKKIDKWKNEDRYPEEWKYKWVSKRIGWFHRLFKVETIVEGWDNIPKGAALLAPNHISAGDGIVMFEALKNPSGSLSEYKHYPAYLAKVELKKNKFSGFMDMLNSMYVDRENIRQSVKVLNQFEEFIKDKKRVGIIFPEGTRGNGKEIGEFKPGVFKIAQKGFLPIVPVTIINCDASTDIKRRKKIQVKVIFHKAIKPMDFISMDRKDIAKMVRSKVVSAWKPATDKKIGEVDAKLA